MIRSLAIASTLILALGLAGAADKDYATVPPSPKAVEDSLRQFKISLAQAVEIAQKTEGGKAGSAEYDTAANVATIKVRVYNNGELRLFVIDAQSGDVLSKDVVSRFPGQAAIGEPTKTDSGLMYYDIAVGQGDSPGATSVVEVHYSGWLLDGRMFDSSVEAGKPATFAMHNVMPGISEGVSSMKAGGKRKLIIPYNLAFGEAGVPNQPPFIPARATLVFDIELVSVDLWSKLPAELPGEPVAGAPVKSDSGLAYYDIKVGEGEMPPDESATVKVHYTGWLVDGTKFDSSRDRGEPIDFPLNGVIAGWTEGVKSMKVGGKRKLIIPYELGYQMQGSPPVIPGGATLIFDVELLEVVKQ